MRSTAGFRLGHVLQLQASAALLHPVAGTRRCQALRTCFHRWCHGRVPCVLPPKVGKRLVAQLRQVGTGSVLSNATSAALR